jgi:energy-coupling factor transport system substrate-specific component
MSVKKFTKPEILALIVVCILLNLGIGALVAVIRLPFYLDSIGTVLSSFVAGPVVGIIVGLASVLVGATYTPTLPAYAGTAIVIALYTSIFKKLGYLKRITWTIVFGIGLGIVAAIVSAPVTAFVYGGVSISGTDAITAFFAATGKNILDSVVLSGLASDPVDKLVTSIIVFLIIKRLPPRWKNNL